MTSIRTGLLTTNAGGDVVLRRVLVRVVGGAQEVMLDGGTMTIGSHADADLRIEEPTVSRFHAELGLLADGVRVRDLDSRNGTYVADNRIEAVVVRPACEIRVGRARVELVPADLAAPDAVPDIAAFGPLVGDSPAMRRVFGLLQGAALSDVPVLFEGETGVGKSAAARALHDACARSSGPFEVFDCLSPRDTLDAVVARASRGTLLVDRLDAAPAGLSDALRAVMDRRDRGEFDFRAMATSPVDLRERVRTGALGRELYFHFAGVRIVLPPLRERREDLSRLVRAITTRLGRPEMALQENELASLRGHTFPGNVRELSRVVEQALVRAAPRVSVPAPPSAESLEQLPFKEAKEQLVDAFERRYVASLLDRHEGNVSRAAADAGLDRNYLARLAKKHGVR